MPRVAALERVPADSAPPRDDTRVFEGTNRWIRLDVFGSERARSLAPYVGAGLSYVAISVFFTPFMTFWVVAFAWLLLWTWLLPDLARRLRR